MIQMLDSPLFKQIITVQDSLHELGDHLKQSPEIKPDDFDFTPTGELHWIHGMFPLLFLVRYNKRSSLRPLILNFFEER